MEREEQGGRRRREEERRWEGMLRRYAEPPGES